MAVAPVPAAMTVRTSVPLSPSVLIRPAIARAVTAATPAVIGSPETGVGGLRRFRKAMDGARIAFSTHGQPRPSTRFAGPPLRSGPAG